MTRLKVLWGRIEKYAIYTTIFVFIILESLSFFIPEIAKIMNEHGGLLFVAAVLLFFFKYIDDRIGDSKSVILAVGKTFTQGIFEIFENKSEVETLDIFAHTGQKYVYALKESEIRIKRLRVLLRSFDEFDTIQFPPDESAKQALKQELSTVTNYFLDLQRQGNVKSLEIRYYNFDPVCHFFIVDSNLLHFGLFQPVQSTPGVQVMSSFIVKNNTPEGHRLINDFRTFFDITFQEFGRSLDPTKHQAV